MKVIICDLRDTGARWLFLGDKVLVDNNFIDDFTEEHPIDIDSRTKFGQE